MSGTPRKLSPFRYYRESEPRVPFMKSFNIWLGNLTSLSPKARDYLFSPIRMKDVDAIALSESHVTPRKYVDTLHSFGMNN